MKTSRLERKWNKLSVQSKFMLSFFFPMVLILAMNLYMFVNVNSMMKKVDEIYISNVNLNELAGQLTKVQDSMTEYLENKGSTALSEYYKADSEYRSSIEAIKDTPMTSGINVMEKNIYYQSEGYLQVVNEIIQAKRGRNVEKYRSGYEDAVVMYTDLQNCIFSLNNEQFKSNTVTYNALLSSLKYVEILSITILIVIAMVNIIVLFFLTRSMVAPLIDLSHAANKVAKGDFDVQLEEQNGEDEISVVSSAFIKMVSSIQQYINEITESMHRESEMKEHELVMENRMKEVQLQSLQAQINPHFLFNTLNAGAQLAMMEGAESTTEYISNMADFFRYNLKKIDRDATIEEEINLVDRYIYILNVRFTGEINYEKIIDESVIRTKVPSMILQPIVENAVNYGIRGIDWSGKIILKVYSEDSNVCLSVKDNGIGMEQSKIDKILSGEAIGTKDETQAASNGIGLANVIERLRIYTGKEDVMSILSEGKNKGTEFIIRIPMYV